MTDPPEGWAWSTVGEVTANFDGRRIPLRQADRAKREGLYDYYGASGVIDHIDGFLFDGEYLLIAEDGANLATRSKPIAFRASGKFWVNNHAHIVQPLTGVDLRFLEHQLNHTDIQHSISGSAQPKLTQANLNRLPILLPPLAEQHRIVAAIDEHLSRLNAACGAARRARLRLHHAYLSLSDALVEGSGPLVPVAEFAEGSKNGMAIGPFGSNLKVSDYREDGVPLVFVRDIRRGCFGGEATRYIAREKAGELRSHRIQEGDVLVTKMGDPPGDAVVYSGPDAVITADCIKLTPASDVHAPFVAAALMTRRARSEVLAITKGVAQKKVSLGRFKTSVRLPMPTYEMQVEIADGLAEQARGLGRLGQAIETAEQRASLLRRSVLGAAFAGQLVPQHPSDEPATALLQRIRSERAASGPWTRNRKAKSA